MQSRLIHRGPDDEGEKDFRTRGSATVGSRSSTSRAASSRCTPRDEQLFLVGNGEIYNFETVKAGLDGPWLTRSDNEVALHLVQQSGPDALKELEGMFALLMAGTDGFFLAARDPVGIKPLFWARRDGPGPFRLRDARVRPGLAGRGRAVPARPLLDARRRVWSGSPAPSGPAGTLPRPSTAWTAEEIGATPPPEGVLAEIRDRFILSVEEQMLGDVPVGVFLSGGLDSSLVAAVAARWCQRNGQTLQTFAVGTEGSLGHPRRPRRRRVPRHRAPRARLHRRRGVGRAARRGRARSSPSIRPWCGARWRTSCSPSSPPGQ